MDFLLFFYECIILSNTAKCKLVHQIDLIWLIQVFILERLVAEHSFAKGEIFYHEALDNKRECSAKKHDLPILWEIC